MSIKTIISTADSQIDAYRAAQGESAAYALCDYHNTKAVLDGAKERYTYVDSGPGYAAVPPAKVVRGAWNRFPGARYADWMISVRARFATRALLDLTIQEGRGPVQVEDIADRQNIPLKYLQQILRSLKSPGFVKSRKGPGGGYLLAKPPGEITLAAVLRHIDGPIAPVSCVSVFNYRECGCPDPDTCALRRVYGELRDAMAEVLESTTFADLTKSHGHSGGGMPVALQIL